MQNHGKPFGSFEIQDVRLFLDEDEGLLLWRWRYCSCPCLFGVEINSEKGDDLAHFMFKCSSLGRYKE